MVKRWTTTIHAINPVTGHLTEYCGPVIEAPSYKLADDYCQNNGLGYCFVGGELVAEIPLKNGIADFENMTDYETINNN